MKFAFDFIKSCLSGTLKYHIWLAFLLCVALLGLHAYCKQLAYGLYVTGLNDQIPWGAYIANFTFLAGMPAVAIIVVVPVYFYKMKDLHGIVIFGELLTLASLVMCILFIMVDLGRPERFWHMLDLTKFNWPSSLLTWDMLVLNGYLFLTAYIAIYQLYHFYRGQKISPMMYKPFLFLSIIWAVSHITVVAFLYCGLGGRPFWNSAVLAPKFLVLVFVGGPAFLILALRQLDTLVPYHIMKEAIGKLRVIIQMALIIDLFLLGCELFTELYTQSTQSLPIQYLFFGSEGHYGMAIWMWAAVSANIIAILLLSIPGNKGKKFLDLACILAIFGIWVGRGIGIVIPGFIPSPLGEVGVYWPSLNETLVCLGIWASGCLVATLLIKGATAVVSARIHDRRIDAEAVKSLVAEELDLAERSSQDDGQMTKSSRPASAGSVATVFCCFLPLAVVLYLDLWGHPRALPPQPKADPRWTMSENRLIHDRLVMVDDEGKPQSCTECHDKGSKPAEDPKGKVAAHTAVDLAHGPINDRCFNCHHPLNRDTFISHDGVEIAYENSAQLCAKCHGLTYRSWQHGSHGRRTGYWDTSRGAQTLTACIACHNPHNPVFTPIAPAPPDRPGW